MGGAVRTTAVIRVPLVAHERVQALVADLNASLPRDRLPGRVQWTEAEIYRRAVAAGLPVVLAALESEGAA